MAVFSPPQASYGRTVMRANFSKIISTKTAYAQVMDFFFGSIHPSGVPSRGSAF
jgi:hypothetical protein